jgi:hypothetical protein
MNNDNLENEEQFNIVHYIKENYIGLGLFIFAFFIIYFVDYINGLNALIYSTPSPIPVLSNNVLHDKHSKRKIKKR